MMASGAQSSLAAGSRVHQGIVPARRERAARLPVRIAATATAPLAPANKNSNRLVVTVDISEFDHPERRKGVARKLFEAARDVGFFYIAGHGIPQADIDRAFALGRTFKNLPKEVKAQYPFNPDSYLGWRGPDELETVTGNRLWEWFSFGRYGLKGWNHLESKFEGEKWPESSGDDFDAEEFRHISLEFQKQLHGVALKVLRLLALGLGWDENKIAEPFDLDDKKNPSFMAWNYYPPLTQEQRDALSNGKGKVPPRLHAHADMDVLTVLLQRDGDIGLEIAPGNEVEDLSLIEDVGNIWNAVPVAREWTPLDPKPGCLTVNIGDGLTRWTDGTLKSTYHRVRAPKEGDPMGERWSIPYFVNPRLDYVIQGPEKRWGPVTGFDLLSKTGNAYAARKNATDKSWQEAAYTDEIAHLQEPSAHGNGQA